MNTWRLFSVLSLCFLLVTAGCSGGPDPDDVAENNADAELSDFPTGEEEAGGQPSNSSWTDGRKTRLSVPLIDINPDKDYTLGPRDVLEVAIDDIQTPGRVTVFSREISNSGVIRLPMVGAVKTTGKTAAEVKTALREQLEEFLVDPQVEVSVKTYMSKRVMVMGSVNAPGVFNIPKNSISLIEALSLARGLAGTAGRSAVLTRATKNKSGAVQYLIDLEHMLTKGKPVRNFVLRPGDVLNVPVADQVFVIGYVGRPGSFPLQRRMTALEVVSKAGGWIAQAASPSASFLRRRKPDGNYSIIPLNFEDIVSGQASDVVLRPGDTIVVPQTGLRTFGLESWSVIKGRIPGAGSLR